MTAVFRRADNLFNPSIFPVFLYNACSGMAFATIRYKSQYLFQDFVEKSSLVSLYDFENRENFFHGVHKGTKFCLLTLSGSDSPVNQAVFSFFAQTISDLDDADRTFSLTTSDFYSLNPNTKTCPVFRTSRDAEITKAIYRRVAPLVIDGSPEGNPWNMSYQCMFHMSNDSGLFHESEMLDAAGLMMEGNHYVRQHDEGFEERFLPLYEGKMVSFYDHRAANVIKSPTAIHRKNQPQYLSLEEKMMPQFTAKPYYWVNEKEVVKRIGMNSWWLLGFNNVTSSSTNGRTLVCTALPLAAVGHSEPLIRDARAPHLLLSVLNSFVLDYIARQKIGGTNLTLGYLKQFPVLSCNQVRTHETMISAAILELVYTAWDLRSFANSLDCFGPPFVWDEERRALILAELDALMFHLYGVNREDVIYIMDTFAIVERKDRKKHGEYHTKNLILDRYDAMTHAYESAHGTLTNTPNSKTPPLDQASLTHYSHQLAKALATHYQTNISPPPAHPSQAHPASTRPSWTDRD
ncbi:hypothetical protein [Candidatus Poriferisocius sp.]|uniref:hypothetical protein n=1 Tax=Candidatus Poriferisocius sp. TaxID=3101276 RepID=UPI003B02CD7A